MQPDRSLPSEWKVRFQKWQASGLSGHSWCRENQISYGTFSYWRQKINSDPELVAEIGAEDFVEVSDPFEGSTGLTLEYRGVTLFYPKNLAKISLNVVLRH